jgi:hypothetical protein
MVRDSFDAGNEWDFVESCGVFEELQEEEEEEKQTPRKRVKIGHFNVDILSKGTCGQMLFQMLGFNGAIRSIDCTHARWGKCPVKKANFCVGHFRQERAPTLAFQYVVDK